MFEADKEGELSKKEKKKLLKATAVTNATTVADKKED